MSANQSDFLDEGRAPIVLDHEYHAGRPFPITISGGGITLEASDIEIGAVEIKDSDSDNRVTVTDDGELSTLSGSPSSWYRDPVVASSVGNTTIVTASPGNWTRVLGLMLVASGTVNIKLRSNNTDLTGIIALDGPGGGFLLPVVDHEERYWLSIEDPTHALNLHLSDNVYVGGLIVYAREVAGV